MGPVVMLRTVHVRIFGDQVDVIFFVRKANVPLYNSAMYEDQVS